MTAPSPDTALHSWAAEGPQLPVAERQQLSAWPPGTLHIRIDSGADPTGKPLASCGPPQLSTPPTGGCLPGLGCWEADPRTAEAQGTAHMARAPSRENI